ncbi:MAG TPA: hypothetical protein VN428_02065 [Bryobacteraceae bacterium]|nr:hypothetical protein [Bryobacteraceae bacterium]
MRTSFRSVFGVFAITAGLAAQAPQALKGPPGDGLLLDRIAIVVGTDAITETEVLDEIRVTALLNHEPLEFDSAARRKAAERLVDQQLIRQDMKAAAYPEPENSEAEKMLAEFKRTEFAGAGAYRAALGEYGVTEEQLKAHLLWQLAALRFTDYRFRAKAPRPGEVLREHLEARSEERASERSGTAPRTDGESGAVPPQVDRQLDEWLKQARSRTRVQFREEVFR